ncbi:hypothetical protein EV182_005136, partial [Spiromyces aspiralis]
WICATALSSNGIDKAFELVSGDLPQFLLHISPECDDDGYDDNGPKSSYSLKYFRMRIETEIVGSPARSRPIDIPLTRARRSGADSDLGMEPISTLSVTAKLRPLDRPEMSSQGTVLGDSTIGLQPPLKATGLESDGALDQGALEQLLSYQRSIAELLKDQKELMRIQVSQNDRLIEMVSYTSRYGTYVCAL